MLDRSGVSESLGRQLFDERPSRVQHTLSRLQNLLVTDISQTVSHDGLIDMAIW